MSPIQHHAPSDKSSYSHPTLSINIEMINSTISLVLRVNWPARIAATRSSLESLWVHLKLYQLRRVVTCRFLAVSLLMLFSCGVRLVCCFVLTEQFPRLGIMMHPWLESVKEYIVLLDTYCFVCHRQRMIWHILWLAT